MNRAAYDTLLNSKFVPSSIVATRPTSPTRRSEAGWARGKERDLKHNCWLVQTSDPEKKRDAARRISFDSFVDFPRRSLADDGLLGDNLTKKLLVLSCLTLGPRDHGDLGGEYIAQIASRFDWLVRYRLTLSIARFSDIDAEFAEGFCSVVSSSGVLATIPVFDRLEQLVSETQTGTWTIPLGKRGQLDWDELSATLGTTNHSLAHNGEFRNALVNAFPGLLLQASGDNAQSDTAKGHAAQLDMVADTSVEVSDGYPTGSTRSSSKKMKVMALKGYTETLELTYRILSQTSAHDRMLHYPFSKLSEDSLLEKYGADMERTPTIVPQDMLSIMTEAAKWLGSYGHYIADCLDEFKRAEKEGSSPQATNVSVRPPGAPRVQLTWAHPSRPVAKGEMMLDTAIRHLLASCAILIASFAARRHVGVGSVHYGCLTEHQDGLLEIDIYIGKTDRDRVKIPVPQIIRTVVNILERLSSHLRNATGSKWLFEVAFSETNPARLISISFNVTIKEFLDTQLPRSDGEDRWKVALHQLRRGYGIWFYYGLEGATSDALSLMYRHRDPRMTRIYFTLALPGQINELRQELEVRRRVAAANRTKEQQAWLEREERRLSYLRHHAQSFDDVRCEVFVEKLIAVWRGQESVIGHGGKVLFADLAEMVQKTMAQIRIGSRVNNPTSLEEPLFDRFLSYAKSNFLEPVIGTNMWCRAEPRNTEHLDKANCLKLKSQVEAPWISTEFLLSDLMPDYDFASNAVCIRCPFCVAFEKGQKALQEEFQADQLRVAKAPTASLQAEAAKLLDELEEEIRRAGPPQKGQWQ